MKKMVSEPLTANKHDKSNRKLSAYPERNIAHKKLQKVSKSTKLVSKTPVPMFKSKFTVDCLRKQPKVQIDMKTEILIEKTGESLQHLHMCFK